MLSPVLIMVFAYPLMGFPLNMILGLSIPGVIAIFFVRVQIERDYNLWKSLQNPPIQQDIETRVKEYVALLDKHRRQRKT